MNRFFLMYLLILLVSSAIQAAEPADEFSKANDLYKKGDYENAILGFEKIIKDGTVSSELYYNLGNSYFKSHKYPMALLYFEKAKKRNPGDEEILYNIEITKLHTGDKIEAIEVFFLKRWVTIFIDFFSIEKWSYLSMSSFIIFLLFAGLFLFARNLFIKKLSFWMGLIILCCSVGSFVIGGIQKKAILNSNEAIIITPTITIKSSPAETGTDLFVLHEGTMVQITDKVGDWAEIRINDGNKGWVKNSDFSVI